MLTFTPTVDFAVVRIILTVSIQDGWKIHQIDYSNAFPKDKIDREVYMYAQKMMNGVTQGRICMFLEKGLYGLRESPRIWNELPENCLRNIVLESMAPAPCVFRAEGVRILCYVDELLVMAKDDKKMV